MKDLEIESVSTLSWQETDVRNTPHLIDDLLEFWSRQSADDRYNRFFSALKSESIIRSYRHCFQFTWRAYSLFDRGKLVGFFHTTTVPRDPWIYITTEVDHLYRRHGYASRIRQICYDQVLTAGFAGIRSDILSSNHANIEAIKKFSLDKPHFFCWRGNLLHCFIGPGAENKLNLDLLD